MEGFIGQILWFAGNFAPKNWAFCQGQIINIASNTALFSILGTTYGGNGTTTFALPDFQGRVAIGAGQGPGLATYALGQKGGTPTTTLIVDNLPAHSHPLFGSSTVGNFGTPSGNVFASTGNFDREYVAPGPTVTMSPLAITPTGGNQPFNNMQPFLGMNFVICQYGIFPSRG